MFTCEVLRATELPDGSFEVVILENAGLPGEREDGHVFGSKQELLDRVAEIGRRVAESGLCLDLLVAWWQKQDATLERVDWVQRRQLVVDPDGQQPIRVVVR